ncbi:kelch-like protein 12 [Crassostrea angulata]|uniref:kelch-like protein 12 n=1 Tax=Magallana angulata TaxID=2784310 RepID=UPI0022B0F29F|nr:kelch-like protein 12 [Crassostrea angulata]
MESAALSGLHLQTPYVYSWINTSPSRNSSPPMENRNSNNSPTSPSDTTYSGHSSHVSLIEEASAPSRASSLEGSLAHEVSSQGPRSTIESGGRSSGMTGTISHYEGVGSYLHDIYKQKKICDVSFQVGELLIPVHKVVLASQSTLFKEVFEAKEFSSDPVTPKIIRVKNVEPAALEIFINFLYTGHIEVKNSKFIPDILKLSEIFEVETLSKRCIDGLKNISNAELLNLLPVMRRNKNIPMCKTIMQLLCKNFMTWRKTKDFLCLDVETVCLILSDDGLNVDSEMEVFLTAVDLLKHIGADCIEKIMGCVRFPLLTGEQLFSCFKICPMLRDYHQVIMDITLANWIQTSLSLGGEDPLDLQIPTPRSHTNSATSVASYISNHSSTEQVDEQEDPDVEVEICRMSEDMARDFNTHAYLHSASSSTISKFPLIEQYSNSKLAGDCSMLGDFGEHQRVQREMLAEEKWNISPDHHAKEMQGKQGQDRRILHSLDLGMGERFGRNHKEKKRDPNKSTRKKKKREVEKRDWEQTNQEGKLSDESDQLRKKAMVWGGSQWFLIGGPGHDGSPSKKVKAYSYETKQWTSLAPMNVARMDHTLCLLDGMIYAIGGIGKRGRVLTRVECYNPKTNCWFFVKSLPEPRTGASATTENGRIHLSGGYGTLNDGQVSDFMDTMEIYNVDANKWNTGF